ncbi:SufD family Fe-S cluster assembly protein [Patescibacteria group bacterium]|nr:SufD family Fe-S cluster assembly protein [Patescibacteria group bacterium]
MKKINLTLKENEEKTVPLVWTSGSEEIIVNARLIGRGAKLNVVGAFFLSNKDEVKVEINIVHVAKDTTSDTFIKAVLTDSAIGKFYGLVGIKKGAKNTNTFFREDALLLSDSAKAEAIPSLEIDENEVKAGHASTVGPVDPEMLFYLMSRGIAHNHARKLIVQGYFDVVLHQLPEKEKNNLENFLQKEFNIS